MSGRDYRLGRVDLTIRAEMAAHHASQRTRAQRATQGLPARPAERSPTVTAVAHSYSAYANGKCRCEVPPRKSKEHPCIGLNR